MSNGLLSGGLAKFLLDSTLSEFGEETILFHYLGRFVCNYASCEVYIHLLANHYLKLKEHHARAVIGGMQISHVVNLITRLMPTTDQSDSDKEVAIVLKQFQEIADFRHGLIHRGAEVVDGGFKSTNLWTARSLESVEELTFPIQHLKDAIEDIGNINLRLIKVFRPDLFTDAGSAAMFQPWQYKAVPPKTPHRPPRVKKSKPARPPRPSRG